MPTLNCGAAAALVKTQVMSAPNTTRAAAMVTAAPVPVATGVGLPVTPALASVQVTPFETQASEKLSVMLTAVETVVTLMAVGEAGVAVPAAAVVMAAGVLARLVTVKLKGPPAPPVVIFWTRTTGILLLVKVQTMFAVAAVAAALRVSTLPASVAVPPPAMPVQVAEASVHPEGMVSVIVVAVAAVVSVSTLLLAGFPEPVLSATVPIPFVPEKLNEPVPPTDCFTI